MGLLIDADLRASVRANPNSIISGLDTNTLDEHIKGCAIDLHVGSVFVPGAENGKPGSAANPLNMGIVLKEGETAVIRSIETFKLDSQHAAFVFPASSISIQGLLMTNPGHVDPGYEGHVHVTVINMGRESFALKPKERFLKAFVYKLDAPVQSPMKPSTTRRVVTQELLQKLSPDFLSVRQRTAEAAKREMDAIVKKNNWVQFGIPAIATLVGVIVSAVLTSATSTARFDERIKSLEEAKAVERLKTLELNYPTEKRLLEIENQLKRLQSAPAAPQPYMAKRNK